MNSAPLVSIIMPVYNRASFLEVAIKSIINQSYQNWELIIIDDASTDSSQNIIKNFIRQEPRIKLLKNSTNQHIVYSRNKGLKKAQGKYIAFLDSDDRALPERLERQVNFMENNPKVGVCGSAVELINTTGKILKVRSYPEKDAEIRVAFFFFNPILQSTAIVRKECFDKLGFFDDQFRNAEDLNIWFRFGNQYLLHNLPEVLGQYRLHDENSLITDQKMMIRNVLKARKLAVKKYGYRMNFKTQIAYLCSWLMLIFPTFLVRKIFNWWRDRKHYIKLFL